MTDEERQELERFAEEEVRRVKARAEARKSRAKKPNGEHPDLPPEPTPNLREHLENGANGLDWEAATPEDVLTYLNGRYFLVNEGGRAVIYEPRYDPFLQRRFYVRIRPADFKEFYQNRRLEVGHTGKKTLRKTAAQFWLTHPDRRQFLGGVVLDPSGRIEPDVFNLWEGFAVQPKAGNWNKLRHHMLRGLCGDHGLYFDFLMNTLARWVQFPAERGEVAIVIRGKEGAGKSLLGKWLCRLFGPHGLHITQSRHLVGNFNAHLRNCIFLFADEAFFAGDKQHTGVLKAIVTEDSIMIEVKRVDAYSAPNLTHLLMSSNENWVVPASLKARRWFVLDAADDFIRDFDHFAAIETEMENGGLAAFLHELLHRDLSRFNHRDVPETLGLQEQKKLTLQAHERWWFDVLHRGYVFESKLGLGEHFQKWHEWVSTDILFASYAALARNNYHPLHREAFGTFMQDVGGKQHRPNGKAVVGEHVAELFDDDGKVRRQAALLQQDRPRGYSFGPLEKARDDFAQHTGLTVEWPDDTVSGSLTDNSDPQKT